MVALLKDACRQSTMLTTGVCVIRSETCGRAKAALLKCTRGSNMGWVLGSRGQHSCGILILRHALRVISPLLRSFSNLAVGDRLYTHIYIYRPNFTSVRSIYLQHLRIEVGAWLRASHVMPAHRQCILPSDDHKTRVQETCIKEVPTFLCLWTNCQSEHDHRYWRRMILITARSRGRFPFNRKSRCV